MKLEEQKEYYKYGTLRLHCYVDENKLVHGVYRKYYPSGELELITSYKDGNEHGMCMTFHENGNVWEITFFYNGKTHGEHKAFDWQGDILRHWFFFKGDLHGEYVNFDREWSEEERLYANATNQTFDPIPFLPEKPARKRNELPRTRYQTLEI